ncbi:hypothetical protein FB45DRAFT_865851 [Roridomyces roridus]|uniref:C2 NT-type domain-containing protein n=1 Tax=Roridomyces roridus TaxID=1738132 RepID=A0AAD7C004_9AGAR|nr:hypothetical protein FB45DRAFT_865851 [Roridomyces roridus]
MPAHTSALDDAPSGGKLRAQLAHLLPRHARFNVRITIHQLGSVPLLSGEFGCRWRFKNTTFLKERDRRDCWDHDSGDSYSMAGSDDPRVYAIPPRRKGSSDSSLSMEDDYPEGTTSTRGRTPWLPLRDHSVTWEHPLSTVVQMSIERHTQKLLPHPFKLTVLQRVIAHDPNAPANPRLGTIELDLAEFVDRSSSTLLDIQRTRPRALNLYSHSPVDPGVFDVRALPHAYGTDATTSLIDALFNPTPVRDPRLLNPFTKLVTEEEDETVQDAVLGSGNSRTRVSVDQPQRMTLVSTASSPTTLALSMNGSTPPSARPRWWTLKPTRGRSESASRSCLSPATSPGARVAVG